MPLEYCDREVSHFMGIMKNLRSMLSLRVRGGPLGPPSVSISPAPEALTNRAGQLIRILQSRRRSTSFPERGTEVLTNSELGNRDGNRCGEHR